MDVNQQVPANQTAPASDIDISVDAFAPAGQVPTQDVFDPGIMSNLSAIQVAAQAKALQSSKVVDTFMVNGSKDLLPYLLGATTLPGDFEKLMNNISDKMMAVMAYNMATTFERMANMTEFQRNAERILFDPNNLAAKSQPELLALYADACRSSIQMSETVRKFIAQNKIVFSDKANTPTQKLAETLGTLSPQMLSQVIEMVKQLQKGGMNATTAPTGGPAI